MALPGVAEARFLGEKAPLPEALLPPASLPARKRLASPERAGPPRALLVRDALTRRPLAGVAFFRLGSPPVFLGRTDERGLFSFSGSIPWEKLLARKPGYLGTFLGISTPFFRRLRDDLEKGGALGLAPDPVTRVLRGRVLSPGGDPARGVEVTLLLEEPADPLRPPGGVPPGLAGAWRVALAEESLCRGIPRREPWELGTWGPEVSLRTGEGGAFAFRVFSRGKALLESKDSRGNTARSILDLPARKGPVLRLSAGSWIRVQGPGTGSFRAVCRDGWTVRGKAGRPCGPFLPGEELEIRFFLGGAPAGRSRVLAPPPGKTRTLSFPSLAGVRVWTARVLEKGSGRSLSGVEVSLAGGGRVRTGERGFFRLLLPGKGSRLVTFRGGGIQERTLVVDPARELPLQVEVLPASGGRQLLEGFLAKVTGVVRDARGEPAVSAQVKAFPLHPPKAGTLLPRGIRAGRTDPEGRFRLLLPAPGRYRLRAFHPLEGTAFREIGLARGEKLDLEMVLEPPLRLQGRVTRGRGGLPVEGARVLLSRPGFPSCQARTGRDGRFLLKPWAPGKWTLQVFGPGGKGKKRVLDLPPGGGGEVQVVLDD